MVKVTVNRERCVGAGQCALSAPEVFGQDDDATVVLLDDHPGEASADAVRDAVTMCPSLAITALEE